MQYWKIGFVGLAAMFAASVTGAAASTPQQDSDASSTGATMMHTACRAGDFGGFFEGFSRAGWAERQTYLAPTIRVTKMGAIQSVPRALSRL